MQVGALAAEIDTAAVEHYHVLSCRVPKAYEVHVVTVVQQRLPKPDLPPAVLLRVVLPLKVPRWVTFPE